MSHYLTLRVCEHKLLTYKNIHTNANFTLIFHNLANKQTKNNQQYWQPRALSLANMTYLLYKLLPYTKYHGIILLPQSLKLRKTLITIATNDYHNDATL